MSPPCSRAVSARSLVITVYETREGLMTASEQGKPAVPPQAAADEDPGIYAEASEIEDLEASADADHVGGGYFKTTFTPGTDSARGFTS